MASKATRYKVTDDGEQVRIYLPNSDQKGAAWVFSVEVASVAYARETMNARGFVEVFPNAPAFESSRARASRVAEDGSGHSEDAYRSWDAVAAMLCRRGYSDRQAVAIMVSKWTRWACDSDEDHDDGQYTAATLARFLDAGAGEPDGLATLAEVEKLTRETFGDETGPVWR